MSRDDDIEDAEHEEMLRDRLEAQVNEARANTATALEQIARAEAWAALWKRLAKKKRRELDLLIQYIHADAAREWEAGQK